MPCSSGLAQAQWQGQRHGQKGKGKGKGKGGTARAKAGCKGEGRGGQGRTHQQVVLVPPQHPLRFLDREQHPEVRRALHARVQVRRRVPNRDVQRVQHLGGAGLDGVEARVTFGQGLRREDDVVVVVVLVADEHL
jgi:hypothetical protein